MQKKNMKCAELVYDENDDSFTINLSSDGGNTWGMCVKSKCVRRFGAGDDDGADYIHYRVLTELRECIKLGYKISFRG